MKGKIIKVAFFLLILFILLVILSYIVVPKKNLKEFGMVNVAANGILGEKDNSIDALIIGDSESFCAFTPMQLWEDYGYTSYVYGTAGQCLPETLVFTYKIIKNQKPKIIVLEADNIYIKVPLSTPFIKAMNYVLPVAEYHNRWKTLNKNDLFKSIDYTWKNDYKGYDYSNVILPADSSNYMSYTEKVAAIPKSNVMYLKLLKNFCKINNIELVIVSTPSTINWNYEKHNGVEDLAKKENIEFLDMNLITDELGIDWNSDTRDKGDHMNHFGASKVTKYIGNFLYNKNILENHKEDSYYSDWNETLKTYKQNGL